MSQKQVINILKKYIALLNMSGIPVHKAYLYGSYRNNNATENSDIDILVVSASFDNNDKIRAKAWLLTEQVDARIEPYTIGLKKFLKDDVSPLLNIIREEGLEIV
ncbi:MAG: nucleotidyltransferase domain-containing protein [Bacteroidota bacterium]